MQPAHRELLIAAGVGILFAVSPFTPDDLLPSVVMGAIAGGFFWLYRRRLRLAGPHAAELSETEAPSVPFRLDPWLAAASALYLLVTGPTLLWMYERWTGSIWQNNHGLIVAVAMGILALPVVREPSIEEDDTSLAGLVWLVAGCVLILLDAVAQTSYVASLGVVLTLPGVSLLVLGKRKSRLLVPVFVLGLFLVPLPNTLASHAYLRTLTAWGSTHVLQSLGVTIVRVGTTLDLVGSSFFVADACSGFATIVASAAIAVMLFFLCHERWRRVTIVCAFVPLALAANVLRISMLVLLTRQFGDWLLDTPIHEASGVAAFGLTLVVLLAISGRPRFELRRS